MVQKEHQGEGAQNSNPEPEVKGTEYSYFKVQAYCGATKHFGGYKSTQELARLCHIGPRKRVLEVGCGVGVTAWRLAKEYECFLVGVDLSPEMIAWSRKRAERENVIERTDFRVADAQDLPFADGQFDAVITESVTAFPEDKRKAVRDYVRVTKPGGLTSSDKKDTLRVFGGFITLLFKDPEFRKYARGISPSLGTIRSLFKYLGYGLYAGRKVQL